MRARAAVGWGCGALVGLHAATLVAAPTRGYDGPGAVLGAGADTVPGPVDPRFPNEAGDADAKPNAKPKPNTKAGSTDAAGAGDDPGDPGPPTTGAADSGAPATKPADLEQAAEAGGTTTTTWMPRHRIVYRNLIAARANPVGFVDDITVGYRYQLVARDTELFRDSFLLAGAHAFVTPAFVRLGPTVEVQPAAVLNLSATYDVVG